MTISLTKASKVYAKVVFDILRIFLPDLTWQQLMANDQLSSYLLDIRIFSDQLWISLLDGEKLIGTSNENIVSLDANAIKRIIKQKTYLLFNDLWPNHGSPWGLLTGIRPTKIVHRLWDQGYTEDEIKKTMRENYLLDSQKIGLLLATTKMQREFLPTKDKDQQRVAIYIGIPFCPTRCSYCTFPAFSIDKWQNEVDNYLRALCSEILALGLALKEKKITVESVYIGGGTPTSISEKQLDFLLNTVSSVLIMEKTKEFTVEAGRPDTITLDKLKILKQHAVDRISINPQTMWEETLLRIGRSHSALDILNKVDLAREVGFRTINMDFILGLPGESIKQLNYSLGKIRTLRPENITFHALSIKRGARLKERDLEDEAIVNEMNDYKEDWCLREGYLPYYLYRQKQISANLENVGYCLPGFSSIYNMQMIEERQTVWGLGVGSCSKIVNCRDWTLESIYNPKDLLLYLERIKEITKAKVDKIISLS